MKNEQTFLSISTIINLTHVVKKKKSVFFNQALIKGPVNLCYESLYWENEDV